MEPVKLVNSAGSGAQTTLTNFVGSSGSVEKSILVSSPRSSRSPEFVGGHAIIFNEAGLVVNHLIFVSSAVSVEEQPFSVSSAGSTELSIFVSSAVSVEEQPFSDSSAGSAELSIFVSSAVSVVEQTFSDSSAGSVELSIFVSSAVSVVEQPFSDSSVGSAELST